MARYDAIIVGAGHNGLVTAAYLARAGLKVLVVERRKIVGGACVTEEVWPGYRLSTGAYALSLLRPEVIADLRLKRFGLEFHAKDPQYFMPFPDGKYLFLWRDMRKTIKEIRRFSDRDARSYPAFASFWDRFAEAMDGVLLAPPPEMPELVERLGEEGFRRGLLLSVKDMLDEYFEGEELKAALATQGIIGAWAGPMTPGTAFTFAYHHLGLAGGRRGLWAWVKGGMGQVAQALAKSAEGFGAQIRTECEVERIAVKDGVAHGVALTGGEVIEAKLVVSNADPKRTFLKLVGPDHLDRAFTSAVARMRTEGVAMKVLLALDRLPDFIAYPGKELGPQHTSTAGIAPSVDYLERAWEDARLGRPSSKPFIEAFAQSAVDPTAAPPGNHCLSIYSQYAPYHLRNSSWEEVRVEHGERIIDTLSAYAPNLEAAIVHKEFLSPLDLERRFHITEGHIFHADMSLDQIASYRPVPGWSAYRTPIRNLYLCGSGAHPGGGVSGVPGHNAAKAILRDLRQARKPRRLRRP